MPRWGPRSWICSGTNLQSSIFRPTPRPSGVFLCPVVGVKKAGPSIDLWLSFWWIGKLREGCKRFRRVVVKEISSKNQCRHTWWQNDGVVLEKKIGLPSQIYLVSSPQSCTIYSALTSLLSLKAFFPPPWASPFGCLLVNSNTNWKVTSSSLSNVPSSLVTFPPSQLSRIKIWIKAPKAPKFCLWCFCCPYLPYLFSCWVLPF